jgi:CubicO group peptidase (beta-lactamase class C family)
MQDTPVAAYIVQKITGQLYEDYITEHFFKPLNMANTTYFNNDVYKNLGATLYYKPGMEPRPYRHIIQRPSGVINSSALEMANFVSFLLNRGVMDSVSLINEESLIRMETTRTTSCAKAGLQLGYGLTNSRTEHNVLSIMDILEVLEEVCLNWPICLNTVLGMCFLSTQIVKRHLLAYQI